MPAGVDEKKIKVVIVDDHVLVRSGLEVVFGMFDDIELAGQAGDGDEAVRLCRELRPDVVLMDLVMPGLSGVEATRQILATCPGTKVVALTSFTDDDLIGETLRAGAIGYLMKNVTRRPARRRRARGARRALDAGSGGRRRARALGLRAAAGRRFPHRPGA